MTYLYVLSHHDEYGAEGMRATLNREHVPFMLNDGWGNWTECAEAMATLQQLLQKPDEKLLTPGEGHNLIRAWGSVQLHVIELSGEKP